MVITHILPTSIIQYYKQIQLFCAACQLCLADGFNLSADGNHQTKKSASKCAFLVNNLILFPNIRFNTMFKLRMLGQIKYWLCNTRFNLAAIIF